MKNKIFEIIQHYYCIIILVMDLIIYDPITLMPIKTCYTIDNKHHFELSSLMDYIVICEHNNIQIKNPLTNLLLDPNIISNIKNTYLNTYIQYRH